MSDDTEFVGCAIKMFEDDEGIIAAAENAIAINPLNRPMMFKSLDRIAAAVPDKTLTALLTNRRWKTKGVALTVSFLDGPELALRNKIMQHLNAWGGSARVAFTETAGTGQVRIARAADGHWSYLGTDILRIADDQPTMNLHEFTLAKPDAEFHRVVRHEAGHTLGFVHEHLRRELVDRLVRERVIEFYAATQGWSEEQTVRQVLTPLPDDQITATATADEDSIMCYQIPGRLTSDGQPIRGGKDINARDAAFAAACYPR